MSPLDARIAGLEAYATEAARLLRGTEARLRAYGRAASSHIALDARHRYADLLQSSANADDELDGPSLVGLAQFGELEETRHSLLLAALLDPSRTGPLAVSFWGFLIERLRPLCDGVLERAEALGRWDETMLRDLEVMPQLHGAEWERLDIYARVVRDQRYEFGLVVENKVRATTAEQPDQLLRYWQGLAGRTDRTVFVFLTELGRAPVTAGESKSWWIPLEWSVVVAMLRKCASDQGLPVGYRIFASQHADLLSADILGRQPRLGDRSRMRELRRVLENEPEGSSKWARQHREITQLWSRQQTRGAQDD